MKTIESINISKHGNGQYSMRIRMIDEHGQTTYVQRPSPQNNTFVSIEEVSEIIKTCADG